MKYLNNFNDLLIIYYKNKTKIKVKVEISQLELTTFNFQVHIKWVIEFEN